MSPCNFCSREFALECSEYTCRRDFGCVSFFCKQFVCTFTCLFYFLEVKFFGAIRRISKNDDAISWLHLNESTGHCEVFFILSVKHGEHSRREIRDKRNVIRKHGNFSF